MTETEWLQSSDLDRMLRFLQGWAGDRKFRLFACACCRRTWYLLPNEECRSAVETTERFADGLATASDVRAAYAAARRTLRTEAALAVCYAAQAGLTYAVWDAAWYVAWYSAQAAVGRLGSPAAWHAERRVQATLLREIAGNPFHPACALKRWTGELVLLAREVYAGNKSPSVLARLLAEFGLPDWADHFSSGDHPKGCWLLDLILKGKPTSRRGRRRWARSRQAC